MQALKGPFEELSFLYFEVSLQSVNVAALQNLIIRAC